MSLVLGWIQTLVEVPLVFCLSVMEIFPLLSGPPCRALVGSKQGIPCPGPLCPISAKPPWLFFSDDRVVLLVLLKLNGNEKSHSRPEFSSMFPKVVTNVFCSSFLCQNLMFDFAHWGVCETLTPLISYFSFS